MLRNSEICRDGLRDIKGVVLIDHHLNIVAGDHVISLTVVVRKPVSVILRSFFLCFLFLHVKLRVDLRITLRCFFIPQRILVVLRYLFIPQRLCKTSRSGKRHCKEKQKDHDQSDTPCFPFTDLVHYFPLQYRESPPGCISVTDQHPHPSAGSLLPRTSALIEIRTFPQRYSPEMSVPSYCKYGHTHYSIFWTGRSHLPPGTGLC